MLFECEVTVVVVVAVTPQRPFKTTTATRISQN